MSIFKFSILISFFISFSVFALEPTHTIHVWTIPYELTYLKKIMGALPTDKCWYHRNSCYLFKESIDSSILPTNSPKLGAQYLLEFWPYEGTRTQLKVFSFDGKKKVLVKEKIYFNNIKDKLKNEFDHAEEFKDFIFSLNLKSL